MWKDAGREDDAGIMPHIDHMMLCLANHLRRGMEFRARQVGYSLPSLKSGGRDEKNTYMPTKHLVVLLSLRFEIAEIAKPRCLPTAVHNNIAGVRPMRACERSLGG